MFLEELLKLGLDDDKDTCGWLLIEESFWLFEGITAFEKEQGLENLVLIRDELFSE